MHSSPLVSIIIPCYNDGKYLREAVDSARQQTHPSCEIIIIDDHSDDIHTSNVLRALASEGIKVTSTPEGKKGQPAARNTGIALAQGKYILPLDADDKLHPAYIAKACAAMESDPEIRICTGKVAFFGLKRGLWKKNAPDLWGLLSLRTPIVCASLFRRESWVAVEGYNESLILGHEDIAFWISLLELGGRIHELDEILFYYRVKPRSMSSRYASGDFAQRAANALFEAHAPVYCRYAKKFFLENVKLYTADAQRDTSYLYKLIKPLMAIEWNVRQRVKRFVGRI